MFAWALRDKGSEWRAVNAFAKGPLPFIPLVESVCEPFTARWGQAPQRPGEVMAKLGARLAPLTDSTSVWVDLSNLLRIFSPRDVTELMQLLRTACGLACNRIVPVIRTSSPKDLFDAGMAWTREYASGVCLRVDGITHFPSKARGLLEMATSTRLSEENFDIVVDVQDLPRAVSHSEMLSAIPLCGVARRWVVLGGTFPGSISGLSPDVYEHVLERSEWSSWRDQVEARSVERVPLYGDYATQGSLYSPSPQFAGSASVRYTTGTDFVVLRGRGVTSQHSLGYAQYIGHARYLREQPYYREIVRTSGDGYVERIASGDEGTGNQTTWRVASLERHISVVAAQVAQYAPLLTI